MQIKKTNFVDVTLEIAGESRLFTVKIDEVPAGQDVGEMLDEIQNEVVSIITKWYACVEEYIKLVEDCCNDDRANY